MLELEYAMLLETIEETMEEIKALYEQIAQKLERTFH